MQSSNTGWAIAAGIAGLLLLLVGPWGMMSGAMMGGAGMMGGYYLYPWGWLVMLVFWGLIIGGVVLLIMWGVRQGAGAPASHESALDVLKRRYARGEITKEQYEQMKRDLE